MSTFATEPTIANPLAASVGRSLEEVLQKITGERHLLQDFTPLVDSVGWHLAEHYWNAAGVTPFVENEVPFVVTSNGILSEDAANLLFANCMESPPEGQITVLEMGAGSGLFARYFVDAFRELSMQAGVDFYDRLVYLVSDRSQRSVEQWVEKRLFADFGDHVVPGVCDALAPAEFRSIDGWPVSLASLRAVIFNYALDVLPASVVRQGPGGVEQLAVRTSLIDDTKLLRQYTRLTQEQIQEIVQSNNRSRIAELLPIVSLLHLETRFIPVEGAAPPYAEASLSFALGISRSIVNHGAIDALDASLRLLATDGFVLVNDYGNVSADQITADAAVQRFGRTTALGLNFPFIDHHFTELGCSVLQPDGDIDRPIHARLFSVNALPSTSQLFVSRFSSQSFQFRENLAAQAREYRNTGQDYQAVAAYRRAIEYRSRDWHLLGELATFVGLHIRDLNAGVEIARAAVALNPWYSTTLWNVLGDCLFCLGQYEAAHEAHMQAYRIDPRDVRTNLNLSFTLFELGPPAAALNAIAVGLAVDGEGKYRDALLQKQQQILSAINGKWKGEKERMARGIPMPE